MSHSDIAMTLLESGTTSSKSTPAPSQQGKVQIPRATSTHCRRISIHVEGRYCRKALDPGQSTIGHGPIGPSRFGESPPPTTETHHAGRSMRRNGTLYSGAACVAVAAVAAVLPPPAFAALHAEPANALSLPTWAIHISSTVEWGTAMLLFWKYADVTGNQRWKGLTWGMLPLLGGAMAACTYHFFYNAPELDFLVAVQAFLTVLGNATCAWAAYRIYSDASSASLN